jgi:hypothetical protein
MHYLYAALFALLVSPLETLVKWFDGIIFDLWSHFHEALATGALFAYAAILSCDTLIRTTLLPHPVQVSRPKTCRSMHAASFSLCFLSLILFVLLWEHHSDRVSTYVHLAAAFVAGVALIMTFVAIWIDNEGREGVNRHAKSRRRPSPRHRT